MRAHVGLCTKDLDARAQVDDRGGRKISQQGEILVAHGPEDVDAGHVEELAVCRDEDPDADGLAGARGRHGGWWMVDDSVLLMCYTTTP